MPLLDVTENLTDPDFVDFDLVCIRSVQTVDNNGVARNVESSMTFAGAPIPTSSLQLLRQSGAEYTKGAMTFFTKFRLSTGSSQDDTTADIIVFKGTRYTVVTVDEWMFGAGYYQATAELLPLAP